MYLFSNILMYVKDVCMRRLYGDANMTSKVYNLG